MSELNVKIRSLAAADSSSLLVLLEELPQKNLKEKLLFYLNDRSGERQLLGAFLNTKLVALSAVYYIPRFPWASLVYMKSSEKMSVSERLSTVIPLVDFSFAEMESKGCIRVYMVNEMRRRGSFMNAKLYPLVKKIHRLQKYAFIINLVMGILCTVMKVTANV
jgi:hypothetical protein